ncbi:DUF6297 family protein [Lentzea sp. NPDC055074]
MTAFALSRRLRPPTPWRFVVARLYSQAVVFSIIAAVGYGWAYAGLTRSPQGNAWTALWLSVVGAVVLMKVALAFGPVFAGRDRMFWVLSAPVARGPLLRPRLGGVLAVGAVLGAAWPAVVFGLVGAVVAPLVAVVGGAAAGVAVVAGAVVVQWRRGRVQGWLSGLVGVAVVALLLPPGWVGLPAAWSGTAGESGSFGTAGEMSPLGSAGEPSDLGSAGEPSALGSAGELSPLGTVGEMSAFGTAGEVGVALAAWVVAIGLAAVAAASVRHLQRSDLAAGGALAGVVRVSVSWFDLALLGAILAERRARLLGRVKSSRLGGAKPFRPGRAEPGAESRSLRSAASSRSLRPAASSPSTVATARRPATASRLNVLGSRVLALAWTDALRLRRTPNAALAWAALLPVPALVAVGGETTAVPVVHLIAAFLATDRLAAGLRFVCRSPAMRRALGMRDRHLKLAHLAFPAAGAVVWCTVTTAFTPHVSVLNAAISAVGAVAVVYRIATRPPIDYGAVIIDFGLYGPTPLGLMAQFSRGPALLAVLGLVQLAV